MNIYAKLYYLLFVVLLVNAMACSSPVQEVQWLAWETVEEKAKKLDRKVLVWVYDETCPTCGEAENRIFGDASNIAFLNEHYYSIKLGGRHPNPIVVKGKEYKNVSSLNGYDYHELAVAITQSKEDIFFPQIVFLNENMELIIPINGDITAEELNLLLSFVQGDHFQKMSIEEYKKRIENN